SPKTQSGDQAEHFAAVALRAGLAVRHDAVRGAHDGHTQTVEHARQVVAGKITAATRAAVTIQPIDHAPAFDIFQVDTQFALGAMLFDAKIANVAFVLEHVGNRHLELRGRHTHASLLDCLGVLDTRQHVGNGVTHTHCSDLLTSSPCADPECRRASPLYAACCEPDRTCDKNHAADLTGGSDFADVPATSRAAAC